MNPKLDRIISLATLAAAVVAIVLVLKKPATVAPAPQASSSIQANTQSGNAPTANAQPAAESTESIQSLFRQVQTTPQAQPLQPSGSYAAPTAPVQSLPASASAKAEPHVNSEQISSVVSQMLGASGAGLTPDSNVGEGAPNIKDQKVTYDGDTVHGQFLTEIAGKDVWITISGHMGQKDGYATFDPTEFKVGNMEVPVSLINPALQRKLAEERARLKISEPK